ncbi:Ff.00g102380.m01.CDS01 [Fusarium sp. VM40]|nr:Ff.00g102380.m01.CDS01 [Fusarium sp. VM40]
MAEPNPAKRKRDEEEEEEIQSSYFHNFEKFARFADVTFIAQNESQDEMRVCVNSVIMKNASPVFEAMLGPHFKEGHALAQARSGPVEIALPEDDAVAFGHICQVLHCQADTNLLEPCPELLLSIWIVVQKYDLKNAVKLSMGHWVWRQLEWRSGLEDLWFLALLCSQIGETNAFRSVTQQLMLSGNLSFVKLATKLEAWTKGIIPGRVIYKLAGWFVLVET